ncbi:MAG TPA: glycosyltransferase [Terracidiphilus sp.]|nr:glycosyltransferase [Terracidiphilus sp.]
MSHVAQVIPGLDRIGGAEQQVILLARGLKRRGWRVTVVALTGNGGHIARRLQCEGIEFISLEMRKGLLDPRGWLRFHRWLCRAAPDVVHAHLTQPAWLARWSRLAANVPVVVDTIHSSATGGLVRRLGYRLSKFLPDRVTAVSLAAAQAHLAAHTVRRQTLEVIPNGIVPERWNPDAQIRVEARRALGVSNEFLWLAAGRLEPVKDYPVLLRAMALLPDSAKLIIAGCGYLQAELTGLSAELGLTRRLRFLGFSHDLHRWMQAADAFVLSSLWEGLPTVLIEASAAGLPAVATDVPGVREALGPSSDPARLASRHDSVSLARAMAALMQISAEARHAIGARARQYAVEQFSLEIVLNRWDSLYHTLLNGCPASESLSANAASHAG